MIDGTVDKAEVLATTEGALDGVPRRRALTRPMVGLGRLLLRRAVRAEQATMPADPTPADRKSYLPRDMVLSLFQAEHEEHLDATGRVTAATQTHPMASRSTPPFSEGHGIDPGFVIGFLKALPTHLLRRVLFRLPADPPRVSPLADDARVVVVGDWGTGEGLALDVAERMRAVIADAGGRQVHVVHLGDVYYAGTTTEARTRFLDPWPVRDGEPHGSWCLGGNHDMYSAGEGLTTVILTDGRFAAQRTVGGAVTTEFLLANRHWSLIGLDTSWRFRLRDPRGGTGYLGRRQLRWVTRHVRSERDRRTVLFSHHQPFTYGDDATLESRGNLLQRTRRLRRDGRITGWFWGHEHKLVAYGSHDGVGYATCMGHGAILEAPPSPPHPGEFAATFTDPDGEVWRMPGFAVLDLDGPRMSVRYLDRTGQPWRADDVLPAAPAG